MPETLTDGKNNDADFFRSVIKYPSFAETLKRLGFSSPHVGMSQYNAVFIIAKPSWTLPRLRGHERTVDIHFEARDKQEIRLDVGPSPYIGSLDKKPAEKALLAPVIERKKNIIHALRNRMINAADVPYRFDVNTKRLLAPETTASHGAVKFSGCGYGSDPTVAQVAEWFKSVIEVATPLVDEIVAAYQAK